MCEIALQRLDTAQKRGENRLVSSFAWAEATATAWCCAVHNGISNVANGLFRKNR